MGQKEWERQEGHKGQVKVKLYHCRLAALPATNSLTDFPQSGVTEVGQQDRLENIYCVLYRIMQGV